jgi:hypothetical protein
MAKIKLYWFLKNATLLALVAGTLIKSFLSDPLLIESMVILIQRNFLQKNSRDCFATNELSQNPEAQVQEGVGQLKGTVTLNSLPILFQKCMD